MGYSDCIIPSAHGLVHAQLPFRICGSIPAAVATGSVGSGLQGGNQPPKAALSMPGNHPEDGIYTRILPVMEACEVRYTRSRDRQRRSRNEPVLAVAERDS